MVRMRPAPLCSKYRQSVHITFPRMRLNERTALPTGLSTEPGETPRPGRITKVVRAIGGGQQLGPAGLGVTLLLLYGARHEMHGARFDHGDNG